MEALLSKNASLNKTVSLPHLIWCFFLNEATLLNVTASMKKVLSLNEHAFSNEAASQSKVFSLNDDASSIKVFSIK